ncbi:hypothetical protein [Streptomyces eurythermus]|uniref:hypothetical protein n=1 Tax=Streptomyces eurythermus TaxID=42237 RepID=UPI003F4D1610
MPVRPGRDRRAQTAELVWRLRDEAGARPVPGARVGLAHNIGLGDAAVVTVPRAVEDGGTPPG